MSSKNTTKKKQSIKYKTNTTTNTPLSNKPLPIVKVSKSGNAMVGRRHPRRIRTRVDRYCDIDDSKKDDNATNINGINTKNDDVLSSSSDLVQKKRKLYEHPCDKVKKVNENGNYINHLLSITKYPDCLNNYNINDTVTTNTANSIAPSTSMNDTKKDDTTNDNNNMQNNYKPSTITTNLLQKLNSLESFSFQRLNKNQTNDTTDNSTTTLTNTTTINNKPSITKWENLLISESGSPSITETKIDEAKIKELKKKGYVLTKNYLHSYTTTKISSNENYIVLVDHGYIIWILYATTHLLVVDKLVLDEHSEREITDLFLLENDEEFIYLIISYGTSIELYDIVLCNSKINTAPKEPIWKINLDSSIYISHLDVHCSNGIIGSTKDYHDSKNNNEVSVTPCVHISLDGKNVTVIKPIENKNTDDDTNKEELVPNTSMNNTVKQLSTVEFTFNEKAEVDNNNTKEQSMHVVSSLSNDECKDNIQSSLNNVPLPNTCESNNDNIKEECIDTNNDNKNNPLPDQCESSNVMNNTKEECDTTTADNKINLVGKGLAMWSKDGKSIYLSSYEKKLDDKIIPILLHVSYPNFAIISKATLPNPKSTWKKGSCSKKNSNNNNKLLLSLNPSETLVATVVPNIQTIRWPYQKKYIQQQKQQDPTSNKANGYSIQIYDTASLQCLYIFGEGLQLHGHSIHWQYIKFINDNIIYSLPNSYKEPKELHNHIHVWDINCAYYNNTMRKSSTIPKEKFIVSPTTDTKNKNMMGSGIDSLQLSNYFWICIVNQECYYKPFAKIKSNFSGNMYPPGFLISDKSALEYIEDEDVLDNVITEYNSDGDIDDDGNVDVNNIVENDNQMINDDNIDIDELEDEIIVDIISNDTPAPKYIPCHTIVHEVKKQEEKDQQQHKDVPTQKFHKNTIISAFPKSIEYYNQIMSENDPSECASTVTVISRGSVARTKNQYSLYVQPKLRTKMYTKQIPKSYITNNNNAQGNNDNTKRNDNNNNCLACKGRFVLHTCTPSNKYIPTTPEIELLEQQKQKQQHNKRPVKILTIEEMEEKRRIKIEKRRIYDAKRRERKRAEKLALLKQQQEREAMANDMKDKMNNDMVEVMPKNNNDDAVSNNDVKVNNAINEAANIISNLNNNYNNNSNKKKKTNTKNLNSSKTSSEKQKQDKVRTQKEQEEIELTNKYKDLLSYCDDNNASDDDTNTRSCIESANHALQKASLIVDSITNILNQVDNNTADIMNAANATTTNVVTTSASTNITTNQNCNDTTTVVRTAATTTNCDDHINKEYHNNDKNSNMILDQNSIPSYHHPPPPPDIFRGSNDQELNPHHHHSHHSDLYFAGTTTSGESHHNQHHQYAYEHYYNNNKVSYDTHDNTTHHHNHHDSNNDHNSNWSTAAASNQHSNHHYPNAVARTASFSVSPILKSSSFHEPDPPPPPIEQQQHHHQPQQDSYSNHSPHHQQRRESYSNHSPHDHSPRHHHIQQQQAHKYYHEQQQQPQHEYHRHHDQHQNTNSYHHPQHHAVQNYDHQQQQQHYYNNNGSMYYMQQQQQQLQEPQSAMPNHYYKFPPSQQQSQF